MGSRRGQSVPTQKSGMGGRALKERQILTKAKAESVAEGEVSLAGEKGGSRDERCTEERGDRNL